RKPAKKRPQRTAQVEARRSPHDLPPDAHGPLTPAPMVDAQGNDSSPSPQSPQAKQAAPMTEGTVPWRSSADLADEMDEKAALSFLLWQQFMTGRFAPSPQFL